MEVAGGIAAALLAGFSLTTVAQLVISRDYPWLRDWATALLAIAAVSFIYALQLSAMALGVSTTPSQWLDYFPKATSDPTVLRDVRAEQFRDTELRIKYTKRIRWCYDFGILAFLGGLGTIIAPQYWRPWPWGRFIGLFAVGGAFLIEILWTFSNADRPHWLLPVRENVMPDSLPDDGMEYFAVDRIGTADELAKLARLRDDKILTAEEFVKQKTRLLS